MTNTTKNTTKSIFLALSVAFTMGAANATSVPGIDSGTFSFSKPGVSTGDATRAGGMAIEQMNSIMDAVGGTGGADISQTHFWNAMVDPTERNVFNYSNAKPMIEELIFTVTGEIFNANLGTNGEYVQATAGEKSSWTTNRVSATGLTSHYVDGQLSATRAAAVNLMTILGYSMSADTEVIAGDTEAHPNAVKFTKIASGATGYVASNAVAGLATDGTDLASSTIGTATAAAALNADGFNNANKLIELIANELKAGFILNVDNATATLAAIADKHTGFLSASLIRDAKKMKDMIKFLGLQEAAVGTAKGAAGSCVGNGLNDNTPACVAVGKTFKGLIDKLPKVGTNPVADYAAALASVETFASNIISFNNTVGDFDANVATRAGEIKDQFGTIVVVEGSDLHDALTSNDGDATTVADPHAVIDAEFALIADNSLFDGVGLEDFTDSVTVVLDRTSESGAITTENVTINVH